MDWMAFPGPDGGRASREVKRFIARWALRVSRTTCSTHPRATREGLGQRMRDDTDMGALLDARVGPVCGVRVPSRAQLRRQSIVRAYPASAARDQAPRPRRIAPLFAAAVSGATDEIG